MQAELFEFFLLWKYYHMQTLMYDFFYQVSELHISVHGVYREYCDY